MVELVWLIPALPLLGFLVLLLAGRKLGEPGAGWVATLMVAGSFVTTVAVYADLLSMDEHDRHFVQTLFTWFSAGGFSVDAGFLVDPLSITMALFVTGVGSLIHLYSIGYMHGDPKFSKFFLYLNLFVFSMLMLVLGDNLLVTFLGWEGVGACSYFLISFWFTSEANASAGKKAFVTNRIGDWGFMVAIFLAFSALGSVQYLDLFEAVEGNELAAVTATGIAVLLFIGACGKSAQLPLYVWLPDAMAGPTPVSALIHAATMVTAGVYLMTRVNPIIAAAYDWVPDLIAWVGVLTALFAATIAVAQKDIKKVLAYSTISQLGYLFLAVGSGAYVAAIFHMVTHAFFKALLFLGAGSVIHGLHDEQDMRKMGALRKLLPVTSTTFIIGWLAIAGVPPFAGFWSKDEILLFAWAKSPALWVVGLATALLTAFYMTRQVIMVFYGEAKWKDAGAHDGEHVEAGAAADAGHHGHGEPHESPWLMLTPLLVLAGLSIVGGALNLPFYDGWKHLEHWLEPVLGENEAHITVASGTKVGLAVVAIAAAFTGILFARSVYLKRRAEAEKFEPELFEHGWYVDESVSAFMAGPGRASFTFLADEVDAKVIDGAVNGTAVAVRSSGRSLRLLQTGYVRSYAVGVAIGAVVLAALLLTQATL